MKRYDPELERKLNAVEEREVEDELDDQGTQQARWGHLTLVQEKWKTKRAKDSKGREYDTGEREGDLTMVLFCDCGRTIEINRAEFPGRAKMRSCGDRACPYTIAERELLQENQKRAEMGRPRSRKPAADKGSAVTVYLPLRLQHRMAVYADWKGCTTSRAGAELIALGLEQVETEMQAELNTERQLAEQAGPDRYPDRAEAESGK